MNEVLLQVALVLEQSERTRKAAQEVLDELIALNKELEELLNE